MKKELTPPFSARGRIAAEQQLKNCIEFLDIVLLTLNGGLVASFVASLDISLYKDMLALDGWRSLMQLLSQNSTWLRVGVTIITARCLGTLDGSIYVGKKACLAVG